MMRDSGLDSRSREKGHGGKMAEITLLFRLSAALATILLPHELAAIDDQFLSSDVT